jgi:hypothetical protein
MQISVCLADSRLEPEVLKRGPRSDLSDCNVVKTNKGIAT